MIQKNLLLFVFLCCCNSSFAQTTLIDYWLDKHPDWWLKYHDIIPLDKDLAVVQLNDKKGLVDMTGNIRIPVVYTHYSLPEDTSLIIFSRYGQNGVFTKAGREVIPVQYDQITLKGNRFLAYNKQQLTVFNRDGSEVDMPFLKGLNISGSDEMRYFGASRDGAFYGIIDSTGVWCIEPAFTWLYPDTEQSGYWKGRLGGQTKLVHPGQKWTGQQGYYDIERVGKAGFWAQKADAEDQFRFYNWSETVNPEMSSFAKLTYAGDFRIYTNKSMGVLDADNNVILAGYDQIYFTNLENVPTVENPKPGYTPIIFVHHDNLNGLFDGRKWILPVRYKNIFLSNGKVWATTKDSAFVFDGDGRLLHQIDFPSAQCNGTGWFYNNQKPGMAWYINRGWVNLPANTKYLRNGIDDYIVVDNDHRQSALLDTADRVLLDGCDGISDYNARFGKKTLQISYKKSGLNGWLDCRSGKVYPPVYDQIFPLKCGVWMVQQNLKWGMVDHRGNVVVPLEHEDMKYDYEGRFGIFKKDGRWKVWRLDGQPINDLDFEDMIADYNGLCWGKTKEGWKGYNINGKSLVPFFTATKPNLDYDRYTLEKDGKYGGVSVDGAVIVPFEWDTIVHNGSVVYGKKRDSLHVFNPPLTVAGKVMEVFYPTGYLVGENGQWRLIYKNGRPMISETLQMPPVVAGRSSAFWAKTGAKSWGLYDYFGKKLETVTADSVMAYGDGLLRFKNGNTAYILHPESGQKWPDDYDYISKVAKGLYTTVKNGKTGLINDQFKVIIPCIYDYCRSSFSPFFEVKTGEKRGMFDQNGKVCIPLDKYDSESFSKTGDDLYTAKKNGLMGYYAATIEKWIPPSLQDIKNCQVRIPLSKQLYWFRINGLYGIMDEDCREVLPARYKGIRDGERFFILEDEQGKSIFDPVERKILAGGFSKIEPVNDNLLCKKGKQYLFYQNGNLAFTREADYIGWFSENYLQIKDDKSGLYGLLRLDGTVAIPALYSDMEYTNYNAIFARKDGKLGLLDMTGRVVIPFEYNRQIYEPSSQFVILEKDKLCGLFEFTGKQVLPVIYQNITVVENSTYFIVRKNGRCIYLNRDGNTLVPGSWEAVQEFNFGLAAVKNNGKWGYINLKGEVVIPFQYRYAGNFEIYKEARIATVIREKNYMTIGTDGAVVAERFIGHSYGNNLSQRIDTLSAYKEIPFYGGEYAIHGYYFVSDQKTEKKGIVNFLGEYVVRPRYDEILTLEYGKDAIAAFRTGTLWGLLDYHAGELLAPQFDKLEPLSYDKPGLYRVTKNGQTFTINEKGEKQ